MLSHNYRGNIPIDEREEQPSAQSDIHEDISTFQNVDREGREREGDGSASSPPPAAANTNVIYTSPKILEEKRFRVDVDVSEEDSDFDEVGTRYSRHHTTLRPETEPSDCCGRFCYRAGRIIPPGSVLATVASIGATCIGGGILGVPSALADTGVVEGMMWLAAMGLACAFSLRLLAISSERTGQHSFEQLSMALLGKPGLYLVAVMRFINCLGSMTAYVVSISDLISPIIDQKTDYFASHPQYLRMIQAALWLCFMFPVTIPRKFNQLRYVSTAGVSCMIFFSFCVMAHFFQFGMSSDISLFKGGTGSMRGMGVFMFAYVCQVNVVELYSEMSNRSINKFTTTACCAAAVIFTLYSMTGIFGYLEFGNTIGSSILLRYNPLKEPQMLVSFCGVFVKLCASYGLYGNSARGAVYRAFHVEPKAVAFWKHFLITAGLTLITLLLGLFIPNVNTVFHFVGGLCGGFLSFILPALFVMYTGNWSLQTMGIVHYVLVYMMLFMGVVGVVFGTATTIYDAI